jgi:hypothetical protein
MRDILINQVAGFVVSLLTPDSIKSPDAAVHLQGDHIAVAVIDFESNTYKSAHIINKKIQLNPKNPIYFDLASLTKPLTLASTYLSEPEKFSKEEMLLLNHRAGLPSVFKVEENSNAWKSYVENLTIRENSNVMYSDTSAVRLMLNLEKKNVDIPNLSQHWLDDEVVHWKNLPQNAICPKTGMRNSKPIQCVVHDPIAFKINKFVTNAGMFGTIDGVAKTLLNLNSKDYNLIEVMGSHLTKTKNRFSMGWEINKWIDTKPGGQFDGNNVFGHRGYTGTSFWINTRLKLGVVILTNTSSLENGRNQTLITNSKHELRQKVSDFVWKKYSLASLSKRISR